MKVTCKWLMLVFVFLTISPCSRAELPESVLLFSINSQNTARLGIVNTSHKNIDLVISNLKGETIYTRSVAGEENYFQLFSLANMPDGEYTVSLKHLQEIDRKRFIIRNSVATLLKPQQDKPPTFQLPDENTLIVTYLNVHQHTVNIFFMQQDNVIFEDRGLTDLALSKRYSLKQLPEGDYEVRLYSAGKIYTYPFVKP